MSGYTIEQRSDHEIALVNDGDDLSTEIRFSTYEGETDIDEFRGSSLPNAVVIDFLRQVIRMLEVAP